MSADEAIEERKAKILIVDDTPANLRLLIRILTGQGYVLHPATSGKVALQFVESTLPDLILLDILMPDMDGFEVCQRLRANERTSDIPVIFISSVDQVLDKVKAFSVGAVDYVVKPFQAEEVLARVETHLSLRKLRRDLEERVRERTAELSQVNARLSAEIGERKSVEESLRLSEQRYRQAIIAAGAVPYYRDYLTNSYTFMGQGILEMTGYTAEEMTPQHWESLRQEIRLTGSLAGLPISEATRRVRSGEIMEWKGDVHIRTRSNESRWIHDASIQVLDDQGQPIGSVGILQDITERKRAEEIVRASEARYRALYRDNPSMFFTVGADGMVISVNEFGASQLGYTIDELEGESVLKVFYPDDRAAVVAQLETCVQHPWQIFQWEFRKVRKDGSSLWVEEFARTVQGPDDEVQVLIMCQDITDRKQAEEELQTRQHFLTLLNDITRAALETTGLDKMLQTLANQLGALFGADAVNITFWDEVNQRTIPAATSAAGLREQYLALPLKSGDLTLTSSVLRTGHVLAVDDTTRSPYVDPAVAAQMPFRSILGLPLIAGEQRLGAVIVAFDKAHHFTADEIARGEQAASLLALALDKAKLLDELEQRVAERTRELTEANERLRELDQLKDQFVANVSHDLRTPLTNITLYLDLLQRQGAGALERNLPVLQREAKRLSRLIEALLAMARLEQGRTPFVLEPHVLDSLLHEVLLANAVRIADKSLQIIHEPDPDLPAVLADYNQMMELFTNLIGNAVAYTPPGGQIVCQVALSEPSQIMVAVSNSGPAIPPEDLPHLFERFYRGRTGYASGEMGTGLGLAICREIVEQHGGRLGVESEEGQLTTFRIWLPLASKSPNREGE